MNNNLPFISVIIPCRDEEGFISECLGSIISNDYPKEKMEILVVDGMSRDRTREIVERFTVQYSFIVILENLKQITPAALNIGIKYSKGEIILKMDAHCRYETNYISKCVEYLLESGAKNVGGILKNNPANSTLPATAISISLSSKFGAGSSYFRTGSGGPRWVDTVAFGCYRKGTLLELGLFDEKMAKIEDFELNYRLRKKFGEKSILLVPDIVAYYYPSSSNFLSFLIHNFTDGFWTTYPIKFGFKFFSLRHLLPFFFTSILIASFFGGIFSFWFRALFDFIFVFYFLVNLSFSFLISFKKGIFLLPYLMLAFFIRHFFYGLGSIWGLIRIKI